ncbi:hypothetical protein DIT68_07445 [Brumimicrobium oceani]|uniref:Uncharacterized protein n=1 Tax=Brumimicrobium oceani TaxID=2100725 RepID=A0A2U2XDU3_9FLAO|nr:hypothetical protein DIT68_07445 [Brumimicrobium oceani]
MFLHGGLFEESRSCAEVFIDGFGMEVFFKNFNCVVIGVIFTRRFNGGVTELHGGNLEGEGSFSLSTKTQIS